MAFWATRRTTSSGCRHSNVKGQGPNPLTSIRSCKQAAFRTSNSASVDPTSTSDRTSVYKNSQSWCDICPSAFISKSEELVRFGVGTPSSSSSSRRGLYTSCVSFQLALLGHRDTNPSHNWCISSGLVVSRRSSSTDQETTLFSFTSKIKPYWHSSSAFVSPFSYELKTSCSEPIGRFATISQLFSYPMLGGLARVSASCSHSSSEPHAGQT